MINSVTASNPNLNNLLTSAENAFFAGEALVATAANELTVPPAANVSGTMGAGNSTPAATTNLPPAGLPPLTPGALGNSATIQGIANMLRGQSDMLAGVALAHVYRRTTQDLMNMLSPPSQPVY